MMERRHFLESVTLGGLGAVVAPVTSHAAPSNRCAGKPLSPGAERTPQRLHVDAQTDVPGVEYFFLGNGRIAVAIQHATGEALDLGMTPLGLMLWDPQQFARKWSTFTFHPEWGLKRGMLAVTVDGEVMTPDPAAFSVRWSYADGVPTVVAEWGAGAHRVSESFWVDAEAPLLVRDVTLHGADVGSAAFTTSLYYSHVLFTDFRTDDRAGALRADGFAHLELFTEPSPTLSDRFATVEAGRDGSAPDGPTRRAQFFYGIGQRKEAFASVPLPERRAAAQQARAGTTTVETAEAGLDALYRAAKNGLRAVVAHDGRFDASVWQYNMEWVIDASGVAIAATRAGQFDLAAAVLRNVLTRLVNEKGIAAYASRFHDTLSTELNQQGALLGAVWTYWAWSGDLDFVRAHWDVIRRVAEFPLGPRYLHASGLVRAEIDFFERNASAGVRPGFDVGHQAFVAWGLTKAADLARYVGDGEASARWEAAGSRMADAMLHHPTLALVDEGRLIKRRLPDGTRQRRLRPLGASDAIPEDSPLATEAAPLLDPDISTLYPILFGQVAPDDPLARRTLDAVETLWNDDGGGYLRYNPTSDPDAPGGWTFPTAIVGRVLARAGRAAGVRRVLDWFLSVQGSRGGAFFEIYTDAPRPVPPLPPMGIIVWGWAEVVSLFVDGLVGVRPQPERDSLAFQPHLPAGLDRLRSRLSYRGRTFDVRLRRGGGETGARFDGASLAYGDDGYALPDAAPGGRVDVLLR
jgi:hypothetical protein